MPPNPALNAKLKELESYRPDRDEDPEGFREMNERMARVTNEARAAETVKRKRVA